MLYEIEKIYSPFYFGPSRNVSNLPFLLTVVQLGLKQFALCWLAANVDISLYSLLVTYCPLHYLKQGSLFSKYIISLNFYFFNIYKKIKGKYQKNGLFSVPIFLIEFFLVENTVTIQHALLLPALDRGGDKKQYVISFYLSKLWWIELPDTCLNFGG